MSPVTRPSSRRVHNAVFHDRVLEVAAANLGGAACFAGSRDWITALFRESFPEDCPATVDRRLLANFIQRAAYHGVKRGLIVPRPAPLNN